MLNKKNIFNCLFYIFIVICIVIPCVFVTFSTSSMTSDGANFFLNALSSFSSGHLYVENSFDHRARMSVMFLNFLPLNIAYFIFKIHSLKILSYVYSSTLICLPVIFCLYSVYMFKRAEKFYLSIFPMLLLSMGIFPVIFYGCVEAYTAVPLFFIFFQYFLSDIKFKKIDYIVFIILCAAIYDLHEAAVLFMPVIWSVYFKYSGKESKILKFGLINSIIAFIVYLIFAFTPFGPEILSDNALESGFLYAFTYPIIPGSGKALNFHLFLYLLYFINITAILFIKNKISHLLFPALTFLVILLLYKDFSLYNYVMYRFVCIYFLIIFSLFILVNYKKEEYLKLISKRSCAFLLMTFLVVNIYIADFSKSYNDLKNELVKFAENGLFYLNEDFKSFEKIALSKDWNIGLGHSAETASYSIIAVNSVKNRNITKGLIIGYDKNSLSIRCDNERIVNAGALNIAIETEFWDLSDFKDKLN